MDKELEYLFTDLKNKVNLVLEDFEQNLKEANTKISSLNDDLADLNNDLDDANDRIRDLEDHHDELEKQLQKRNAVTSTKADELVDIELARVKRLVLAIPAANTAEIKEAFDILQLDLEDLIFYEQ